MSKYTGRHTNQYGILRVDAEVKEPDKGLAAIALILGKLAEEVSDIESAIDKAALDTGYPVAQKVTKMPNVGAMFKTLSGDHGYGSGSSWYHTHYTKVAEAARAHLKQIGAELDALHEVNAAAIASNKVLYERMKALFKSIGIPETYQEEDRTSRKDKYGCYKRITVNAGWLRDLHTYCVTDDGYQRALERIAEQEKAIGQYEVKEAEKERQEKDKAEKEKARISFERGLGIIAERYGLQATAGLWDIMDAILGRNKYLALAHRLLSIREDWSDSPMDRARNALDDFKAESFLDKEIKDYWYELVALKEEQGDTDGRVFRDGLYNYDFLFGLVVAEEQLLLDYNKIKGYLDA